MRLRTAGGPALVCYCANVHPGDGFADVLAGIRSFAGPVRRELGIPEMGLGLWLSRRALTEILREGVARLRDALAAEGLFVFTMNGFPYGNFQGEVVKRDVYRPDLSTDERRIYLTELAEILAALLPADAAEGTISTLPLGHREEMPRERRAEALRQLGRLGSDLARLRERTGRAVRICIEPEPGCVIESSEQAAHFFAEELPQAGLSPETIATHLGLSFDTCHQSVAFEDARASLTLLSKAGARIGKVQLSSALVVDDPSRPAARAALRRFDERRFLHQVRHQVHCGVAGVDDLDEMDGLPVDRPWRVHFHVPIHREAIGTLGTTRGFLEEVLQVVTSWPPVPHLEIETYTWPVLPEGERPERDAGLVRGLAAEMKYVVERLQ